METQHLFSNLYFIFYKFFFSISLSQNKTLISCDYRMIYGQVKKTEHTK